MAPPPSPSSSETPLAPRRRTWVRDILEVLAIALVLYLVIWNALQTVRVDGHSMDNTLQDQDLLLASKISYHLHNPERGDIVILIPPLEPDKDFIKRVIAIPGDQLRIDGNKSPVEVDIKPGGSGPWQKVSEPYLREKWLPTNTSCCLDTGQKTEDGEPRAVTVPPDMYFVMGDNRNFSSDSRVFGWVAKDKILAKAFLRVWPFFHFGLGVGNTLIPAASAVGLALPPSWLLRRGRRRRRRRTASPR